jgi:ribosome-binding factor A
MGRIDKINHQIQRIVSQIIQEEVDNPHLGMVSVVRVETTPDLQFCKIFFSVFPEQNTENVLSTLQEMRSFIKKLLGKNLRIRFLPDLEFVPDDSIKYSVDIYEKIERLKDEPGKGGKDNKK